ncbi:MAG: hypothetical protein IJX87_06335 [Clostridia bacterium]|nr:hypothetical protein [Clostridia bacterium]
MELVRERAATEISVETQEAQAHNAQIRERYLKLQSMEATQFASEDTVYAPTKTRDVYVEQQNTSTYMPNFGSASVVEQAPHVTEYVRSSDSPLFTTEKFERFAIADEPVAAVETYATPTYIAPTYTAPSFVADVTTYKTPEIQKTEKAESYELSIFAKLAMVLFAVVVVALLSWIGVNSRMLDQKNLELQNLEAQREELIERNAEIQRRITDAKSEETIRQYAQSQGIVID